MALKHELAELFMIVGAQSLFSKNDPLDFIDDMFGAFVFALRQARTIRFQKLHFDRPEGTGHELLSCGFAVLPELVVLAPHEFMFDAGIANYNRFAKDRSWFDGEETEVNAQHVPGLAE